MKYFIIPILRFLEVAFIYIIIAPYVILIRTVLFLWNFNDDGYKKLFPKEDGFYNPKNSNYYYKNCIDYVLNRKTNN